MQDNPFPMPVLTFSTLFDTRAEPSAWHPRVTASAPLHARLYPYRRVQSRFQLAWEVSRDCPSKGDKPTCKVVFPISAKKRIFWLLPLGVHKGLLKKKFPSFGSFTVALQRYRNKLICHRSFTCQLVWFGEWLSYICSKALGRLL